MGAKHSVEQIFEQAAKFVVKQKGTWDHADWENFLGKIAEYELELHDELMIKLGALLELGKYFYSNLPETVGKKPKKTKKNSVKKTKESSEETLD
ncbi:MAG TPA: hypothetical protein PLT82_03170 [Candidatus Hydrogenedens sp.]|nr:hypothetical protein [Candidatus Hydrogenedens sp.]HOK08473.1 hypothetical protein [Candidatus Hydrogenedens sp.]HOL20262.1 hypothetical protein [Candidatus Hydrogenedens sp.]HPP58114.1 hypothetical protein [Candidatus Hydrogenedens sp.]